MCGRYALYGPASRLRERFEAEPEGLQFEPRYNAAPMQWLPVVRQRPNGERVIQEIKRVSKPGCRVYRKAKDIPVVLQGLGISILSTSQGILSNREAKAKGIGGEVLCSVL